MQVVASVTIPITKQFYKTVAAFKTSNEIHLSKHYKNLISTICHLEDGKIV